MTRLGVAAICSVLMTAGGGTGQNSTAPVLASNDITVEIGNEVDARNVVAKVLTHAMANHERREFFLASQVRNEWLPAVQGVEFVRLSDTDIAGHLSGCGLYWIISRLERADNVVSMWLEQRCGGRTLHYVVSFDGNEWRLGAPGTGKDGGGWIQGIGSGVAARPPGCPCFGR
jgi:hypothetical protein